MTIGVDTGRAVEPPGSQVTGSPEAAGRPRPALRLAALGAALGLAGAVQLALVPATWGAATPGVTTVLTLSLLFLAAESSQVHVVVRRQTHSVSFSELPMVIGLFLLPPLWLVAVRLLAACVVYALRRAAPSKTVFNLGLFTTEVGTASLAFHLLGVGSGLQPRDWAIAYATMMLVAVVGTLAVTGAITLIQGRPDVPRLAWTLLTPNLAAVFNTTLALLALLALSFHAAGLLLTVAVALLAAAYRVYDRLMHQHADLGQLVRFTRAAGTVPDSDASVQALLHQARELLRAETATISRPHEQEPGERWHGVGPGRSGPVVIPRGTRDPHLRDHLVRTGWRDAVLVPLTLQAGASAVLQVGNSLGTLRTFGHGDLQLLQTLAAHAEVTWRNERLLEQARHDAAHDGLTGLVNRSGFQTGLERVLAGCTGTPTGVAGRAETPPTCPAVLLLDLDRFQDVNDSLGHHTGDLLLQQVARRLLDEVPGDGLVARFGGDEFAVLLPGCTSPEQAVGAAQDIRTALSGPFRVSGTGLEVGVSIGVTVLPQDGRDPATVLQHADVAMYQAKRSSQGVVRYRADDEHGSRRRLTLAGELRHAIDAGEITVHYQPQMSLRDSAITGYEALARWEHPTRGLLTPDEFIPIAEQTGLITSLTHSVLGQALERCRGWQGDHPGEGVAVNLSTRDLRDRTASATVDRMLREAGLDPTLLTLEITESSVIGDLATAMAVLQSLRDLGVRLSLDDFGIGYSSLTYLQRLPVDEVKIDRSFVTPMNDSPSAAAITRAVVDLGHSLGLTVVAEGVEDEQSRRALAAMGCDTAQGYLLSRPLSPDRLTSWQRDRSSPPREGTARRRSGLRAV